MTMTRREAAIVTAHTGHLVGYLGDFYKYVDELFGYNVPEKDVPHMLDEIKERSKKDFYNLNDSIRKDN